MKLEEVCIQLCQGGVSVGCTDKPCIVDSVPDHMVVVVFQKLVACIPVVVQDPFQSTSSEETETLQIILLLCSECDERGEGGWAQRETTLSSRCGKGRILGLGGVQVP